MFPLWLSAYVKGRSHGNRHQQTSAAAPYFGGAATGDFVKCDHPEAPRRVRRPPAEKAELVRILGELGKIGSNVNQLAAKANIGVLRVLDPMALTQLQDDLDELRDDLMRALGRQP